jgi:hypothetical protein
MGLIERPLTPRQEAFLKLRDAAEFIGIAVDQLCYRSDIEPADFLSDLDGATSSIDARAFDSMKAKLVALIDRQAVKINAKKLEVQSIPTPQDAR